MILVTINNREVNIDAVKELTILQTCQIIGIEVPRFCYHERLSIAGNCRMCLIEIHNVHKPILACALPVVDGMQIYTDSLFVRKARESVLEFLLVNHPLDCPICDQGGECDLQDQTMIFGNDRGRFYDIKRAVEDKNCGPLIKTIMTRCIHCTRCVRFATEIAGINELGILGRGNKMEIGTYVERMLDSEISGNLIDLCPVGALTSKPYAFTARPWEVKGIYSIDIFDVLNSNIRVDIRGNQIMRILPKINDILNEEWITDKVRFIYDSFYNNRLETPLKLVKGKYIKISWTKSLSLIIQQLKKNIKPNQKNLFENFVTIIGNTVSLDTLKQIKEFNNLLGTKNYYMQYYEFIKSFNNDFRQDYLFNLMKKQYSIDFDFCLLINSNLRLENPLLFSKIRRNSLNTNKPIFLFGSKINKYSFVKNLGNKLESLIKFLEGRHKYSSLLLRAKHPIVIFGLHNFLYLKSAYKTIIEILKLNFNNVIKDNWFGVNISTVYANLMAVLELGMINQKLIPTSNNKVYYLVEADSIKIKNKENFLIYQGHHNDINASKSDLILPNKIFTEKEALYFNFKGDIQETNFVTNNIKNNRSDIQIIKALYNFVKSNSLFRNFNLIKNNNEVYGYSFSKKYKSFRSVSKQFKEVLSRTFEIETSIKNEFLLLKNVYFNNSIFNYHLQDSYTRASKNMINCSVKFKKNLNLE